MTESFFTIFDISDKLPDDTTFCCFHNKLISLGLIDNLFSDTNLQLKELGLKVRECEGAIKVLFSQIHQMDL